MRKGERTMRRLKTSSVVRPMVVTAGILLIPLFGNLFVDGWNWPWTAFAFFGAVLFGAGVAWEVAGTHARTGVIIGFAVGVMVACGVIATLRFLNPEEDVAGVVLITLLVCGLLFAVLGYLVQRLVWREWRLGSS